MSQPFTPRVKNALQEAQLIAARMDHRYVGSEHLLLALVRNENGATRLVLKELGITPEAFEQAVLRVVGYRCPILPAIIFLHKKGREFLHVPFHIRLNFRSLVIR